MSFYRNYVPTYRPQPVFDRDTLRETFDYDPATGNLIWLERDPKAPEANAGAVANFNKRNAGKVAGTLNEHTGYIQTTVFNKLWTAHRLVWIWHNDAIPKGLVIDHINNIRDDNRIENLRLLTPADNARNIAKGPVRDVRTDMWIVQVHKNGRMVRLGAYSDYDTAQAIYDKAKKRHQKDAEWWERMG